MPKTAAQQQSLIGEKWADLTKPTKKKFKSQSHWQRCVTVGRGTANTVHNAKRLAKDTKAAWQQARERMDGASDRFNQSRVGRAAWGADALAENLVKSPFSKDARRRLGNQVTGQRRAKVKQHNRTVNGKTITVARDGMTKGRTVGMVLALLMLFPTAVKAQSAPCILTGGTPQIEVVVSAQMNLTEYHIIKNAMGNDDMAEHEFLSVLRSYCPDQLRGVDKLDLSLDHPLSAVILHESTRAAQRAAVATAEAESGAYTVYGDRPDGDWDLAGRLAYDNGWRLDTDGDWRSPNGSYGPAHTEHDPFQNMPQCWHDGTCNRNSFPTAEQTRARLLGVKDYAVAVAVGPQVIEGSGPAEPTPEPTGLVANEFLAEQSSGVGEWFQWLASFCGTMVLIAVLIAIVLAGAWMTVRLRKQQEETKRDGGKHGLGTYPAAVPKGVS